MDYTALLTLMAVAFAGAGAATGLAAGLPAQVAHVVRTAICIVGGDVCRPVDAAAEGLEPCVLDERGMGGAVTLSIVFVRIGEGGEWTVARRSDGTVLVTRSDERRAGVGTGVGFALGELEAGATVSLDGTLSTGTAWQLPSIAAASALLQAARDGRPLAAPTWRFGTLGEEAQARAGLNGLGVELTGVEASWRAAAGVRIGKGERTLYLHAGLELTDPLGALPSDPGRGSSGAPAGGRTGPLLLSLTRDAHGLRELAFRRVTRGARRNEVVETVGRLDLRDPENRAVADRLLRIRLPWPRTVVPALRAVVLRTAQAGTIERSVYAVHDRSHEFNVAARLAVELGLETSRVEVARHLIGASAWTHGSPERRRVDCVGAG